MTPHAVAIATTIGAIACAGFVIEAALGFGSTVVVVSLAAQLLPIDVVLPAFVPVNIALSAWIVLRHRRHIAWRTLGITFAPPVAIGFAAGIFAFDLARGRWLPVAFGVFVVVLSIVELARRSPSTTLPAPLRVLLLALGGAAHGAFGAGGPMLVYVGARVLPDKAAFRASLSLIWLVLNAILVGNFLRLHLYARDTIPLAAAIAAGVIPALVAGEWLHRRLEGQRFVRIVFALLAIAGGALVVRSVA